MKNAGSDVGHRNNFNLIRLIAAYGVMFSHSFGLRDGWPSGQTEPIWHVNFIAWCCVSIFFVMSGYLVTLSLSRDDNLLRYAWSRGLRILPGLFVCTLLTVVVAGLFLTTLSPERFFSSPTTIAFALHNCIAAGIRYYLPGVFERNLDHTVNGSLWTLPYEICCYALLAAAWTMDQARRASLFPVFVLSIGLAYSGIFLVRADALPGAVMFALVNALRFQFCFGIGVVAAVYSQEPRLAAPKWRALLTLLVCASLCLSPTRFAGICFVLAMAALWFAFLDRPALKSLRRLPDISYGVYIYAYPVQQTVVMCCRDWSWICQLLLSTMITCALASCSWYLVERPALSMKRWLPTAAASA